MEFKTFGFIGLGLISGSIARAVKERFPDSVISAFDPVSESLSQAEADGVIDAVLSGPDDPRISDCDIVFLGAPVRINTMNLRIVKRNLRSDAILTDIGSVKSDIHKLAGDEGLADIFIGGHPMTGSERTGYRNSKARLLENAYYILAPEENVPTDKKEAMTALVKALGAIPIVIRPQEHDYYTAGISHLPHVAAAALVNLIRESDSPDGVMKTIAAGGFKDITRISSSQPEMWRQICLTNRDNILPLLDRYIDQLGRAREMISSSDSESLYAFFDSARKYRDSFPEKASGPIIRTFPLNVDIADKPGALAKVVSILAENGINIKNVGITHNREYQEGALRVEFGSEEERTRASEILKKEGYVIY